MTEAGSPGRKLPFLAKVEAQVHLRGSIGKEVVGPVVYVELELVEDQEVTGQARCHHIIPPKKLYYLTVFRYHPYSRVLNGNRSARKRNEHENEHRTPVLVVVDNQGVVLRLSYGII